MSRNLREAADFSMNVGKIGIYTNYFLTLVKYIVGSIVSPWSTRNYWSKGSEYGMISRPHFLRGISTIFQKFLFGYVHMYSCSYAADCNSIKEQAAATTPHQTQLHACLETLKVS